MKPLKLLILTTFISIAFAMSISAMSLGAIEKQIVDTSNTYIPSEFTGVLEYPKVRVINDTDKGTTQLFVGVRSTGRVVEPTEAKAIIKNILVGLQSKSLIEYIDNYSFTFSYPSDKSKTGGTVTHIYYIDKNADINYNDFELSFKTINENLGLDSFREVKR